jgi:hypothetical protein
MKSNMTALDQFLIENPDRLVSVCDQLLTPKEIFDRFNISRQMLTRWRKSNRVIGFPYLKNRFRYPEEQFLGDRSIVAGLASIIALAPTAASAWSWLTQRCSLLGRARPIDLLRRGKAARVLEAALTHYEW